MKRKATKTRKGSANLNDDLKIPININDHLAAKLGDALRRIPRTSQLTPLSPRNDLTRSYLSCGTPHHHHIHPPTHSLIRSQDSQKEKEESSRSRHHSSYLNRRHHRRRWRC